MTDDIENQPPDPVRASAVVTGVMAGVAMILMWASTAWSCVAMGSLTVTPSVVQPGQQVQFSGAYYHDAAPVLLHWDSLEAPAFASVGPGSLIDFGHGYWRTIDGRFDIPSDATLGAHVVIATQEGVPGRPIWGVPARAVVQVGEPGPPSGTTLSGNSPPRLPRLVLAGRGGVELPAVAVVGLACFVLTVAATAALFRVGFLRRRPGSR